MCPLSERTHLRILLAANVVLALVLIMEIGARFLYEISGAFNGDSPIYWAVGRGLVNGLTLYKDIFDIKPPGMFLTSAVSFWLTETTTIAHLLQGLAIVLLPVTMLVPFAMRRTDLDDRRRLFGWLLWMTFAGCITLYVAKEGGEFQTESFGVLFLCAYVGVVTLMRRSSHWIWIVFAGICVFGGILFKEPFILTAVAAGLLLCRSWRDVVRMIILPCVIGGILLAITFLFMGALDDYFTIYLPFMMSNRTQRFGSPFSRAFLLEMVWIQLWRFSPVFALTIGLVWLWSFIRRFGIDPRTPKQLGFGTLFLIGMTMFIYGAQTVRIFPWVTGKWYMAQSPGWIIAGGIALLYAGYELFRRQSDRGAFLFRTATLLFALASTGFLAGLSGEFLGHHMLFAIPIYVALAIECIDAILDADRPFTAVGLALSALLILTVLFHHRTDYTAQRAFWTAEAARDTAIAETIDEVLTSCGIPQYLIIGETGTNVFGYTRHSPMGPIFFQHTLVGTFRPFTLSYVSELVNAQVIFRSTEASRKHNMQGVDEYLAYTFSEETPPCAGPSFRQPEGYRLLFRKSSVPVFLNVNEEGDAGITFEQVPSPPEETVPSVYEAR